MTTLDKVIAAVTPLESREKRADARAKARAAARPGDWLSLILDHHEKIEAAFAALKSAPGAASRRTAQKKLATLLNGHAIAEEAVIYPALADVGMMIDADLAYVEQVAAKMQIAALEKLDPEGEDYADKLGHLEGAVVHHVYEEEQHWFPALREKAPEADQDKMTERYQEEYDRYIR